MRLREISGVDSDSEVTGFAIDHRKVAPGSVFGAFKGAVFNGEDFIPEAVTRGAVAVVARPEAPVDKAAHLADEQPRRLFAQLAAKFFAPYPEIAVAVTGTNGKTSTVEMTRQMWRMVGHRSASIGTLGVTTSDDQVKTGLTTPDIVTFLSNVAGLKRMGISHVAYEASSHGLDQHRAEGVPLAAAAFTNFSRDHLDYHLSMDDYFEAKMRLFDELLGPEGTAVVWTDDGKSDAVIERVKQRGSKLMTVGRRGETIRLLDQVPTPLGQTVTLAHEGKTHKLALPLIGAYQAANVLVAAGLVMATGTAFDAAFSAMQRVSPVRGRSGPPWSGTSCPRRRWSRRRRSPRPPAAPRCSGSSRPTRRPRWSPATTCWPSAATTPWRSGGSPAPRTSASSGSTTCRSCPDCVRR